MKAAVFEANHTIHPEFAARNSPEIGFVSTPPPHASSGRNGCSAWRVDVENASGKTSSMTVFQKTATLKAYPDHKVQPCGPRADPGRDRTQHRRCRPREPPPCRRPPVREPHPNNRTHFCHVAPEVLPLQTLIRPNPTRHPNRLDAGSGPTPVHGLKPWMRMGDA